jgi:hypothetical protein
MTPAEVQRALRSITSPAFQRKRYFPVTVIAQMAGLSRETVRLARHGLWLTPRVVEALSPILSDVLAGRLVARRNAWQVEAKDTAMEERQFSAYNERPRRVVALPDRPPSAW